MTHDAISIIQILLACVLIAAGIVTAPRCGPDSTGWTIGGAMLVRGCLPSK